MVPLNIKNNGYHGGPVNGLMEPQRPIKTVQSGIQMKVVIGWNFTCYDYVEDSVFDCWGDTDNAYVCNTGESIEWPNFNENDLSIDHSVVSNDDDQSSLESSA